MPTYTVRFLQYLNKLIKVKAESPEKAIELVAHRSMASLCWKCSERQELDEPSKVMVEDEDGEIVLEEDF